MDKGFQGALGGGGWNEPGPPANVRAQRVFLQAHLFILGPMRNDGNGSRFNYFSISRCNLFHSGRSCLRIDSDENVFAAR